MSSVEEKLEKNKDALMKKIESVETNLGKIARFLKKGFDKKFASVDKKFASIKINIDTLRSIDAELETKYDYLKKMENMLCFSYTCGIEVVKTKSLTPN